MSADPFTRSPGNFTNFNEFQKFLNTSTSQLEPIDQLNNFLTHSSSGREISFCRYHLEKGVRESECRDFQRVVKNNRLLSNHLQKLEQTYSAILLFEDEINQSTVDYATALWKGLSLPDLEDFELKNVIYLNTFLQNNGISILDDLYTHSNPNVKNQSKPTGSTHSARSSLRSFPRKSPTGSTTPPRSSPRKSPTGSTHSSRSSPIIRKPCDHSFENASENEGLGFSKKCKLCQIYKCTNCDFKDNDDQVVFDHAKNCLL